MIREARPLNIGVLLSSDKMIKIKRGRVEVNTKWVPLMVKEITQYIKKYWIMPTVRIHILHKLDDHPMPPMIMRAVLLLGYHNVDTNSVNTVSDIEFDLLITSESDPGLIENIKAKKIVNF